MPIYMTQWNYKDTVIHDLIADPEGRADRSAIARTAIEAFGGKMLGFYFCLGEYDGLTISEFDDEEAALACVLAIFGQGNARTVQTTTLFPPDSVSRAAKHAHRITLGD